jgi:uridine phosphorylase
MLTVQDHLNYLKKMGKFPPQEPPKRFIFTFVGNFFREVLSSFRYEPYLSPFTSVYRLLDFPGVAFGNFKIGAAVNAMKMDQLIHWGVREFYAIGMTGAIAADLRPGDIVLASEAIREEGVSRHYVGPGEKIQAPGESLSKWEEALAETGMRKGTILTHDAIYRLTRENFLRRRAEGVLGVEMETAALYAVAECRGVAIASGLVVSDYETEDGWHVAFHDPLVVEGQRTLLRALL